MSLKTKLTRMTFSDLEKVLDEFVRLQKENLTLQFELAETRQKVDEARQLALIEEKVYSGIKKIFK